MIPETKVQISKMLYHLSTENRASADKQLKEIVNSKVQNIFNKEYDKVKSSFSKEK